MGCMTLPIGMRMDNQDRPLRPVDHVRGDAPGHQTAESGVAMGSDDDEACVVLIGGVNDGLPGGSSLDRQAVSPEAGRLS